MDKIIRFMRSRYGIDELSKFLMGSSLAVLIISTIFNMHILYLIATGILLYGYVRILSKNYSKMSAQNRWFLDKTKNVRTQINKQKSRMVMRKTHHLYRCSNCRQIIRVPKGKGRIEITCPRCNNKFVRKS